jgi:hypothetical protein
VELEVRNIQRPSCRSLTMQRNKVHHVYTIEHVAKDLCVTEDLIHDLTLGLEPEDGLIWVYGIDDDGVLAFTDDGIEEVRLLIEEYNLVKPSKP